MKKTNAVSSQGTAQSKNLIRTIVPQSALLTQEPLKNQPLALTPQQLLAKGLCYKCQDKISIPGIDGYHCLKCGWVDDPTWKQERIKVEERKAQEKAEARRQRKIQKGGVAV